MLRFVLSASLEPYQAMVGVGPEMLDFDEIYPLRVK
jgi:hypothetical protein